MEEANVDSLFKRIRLLRKKLKQIETLKLLPRKLNSEEIVKIDRQDEFREELLDALALRTELQQKEEVAAEDSATVSDECDDEGHQTQATFELNKSAEENRLQSHEDESPVSSETPSTPDISPIETPPAEPVRSSPEPVKQSRVKPAKSSTPPRTDPLKVLRDAWTNKYFDITELVGHTDIIMSVDISSKHVLSGSRDTSVKLWNAETAELIQNFGGHTGQVNCVKMVEIEDRVVAVSGSEDCSIRFWNISSGAQLREFYVYNSVLCFSLLDSGRYLAAGLDGGKLEVYDLQTSETCLSHSIDTESITCLSSEGSLLAVGGSDCLVEVLEFDGTAMKCLHSAEENEMMCLKSISLKGGHLLVGDDQANIKIIHWKRGSQDSITSIANHHSEFGVTDALCRYAGCLFSSAYDYDAGVGFLNIRDTSTDSYEYITSVTDPDILHILSLAVTSSGEGKGSDALNVVTGGIQLVLWREDVRRSADSVRCKSRRLLLADELEADDYMFSSDEASDQSESDSETEQPSSGWWCNLL